MILGTGRKSYLRNRALLEEEREGIKDDHSWGL